MSETTDRSVLDITLELPRKLKFLMEMHTYKVAYGGRNSLKSHSFAGALLTLGLDQSLRILCAREIQKSLTDSVHQLLRDKIKALQYDAVYEVKENSIVSRRNDTLFRFSGLSDQTAASIKSFEGFDILWAEEAQAITKRSWQVALPTIFRTPNSEVWVSFNPDMDSDETWERFVVNPPPGAMVVEMNWRDAVKCGWWTPEQEKLRQRDLVHAKDDYDNIWEGKPRTVVAGAVYAHEIIDMISEGRYRSIPYDPRFPVHRIWDLGWNDLMVVIMVQKPHPSALSVINYIEEKFITYAQMIQSLDGLRYRWGDDWLPHDATQHHPTSGTNAGKQIQQLTGRIPKEIPKSADEPRIRAGRAMCPRVYIDNSKRETPTDRPDRLLGAAHLVDRLKRLRRIVSKATGAEGSIMEDINIHAGDAWGSIGEIVDRIRNDGDIPMPEIAPFQNVDSSMGLLG